MTKDEKKLFKHLRKIKENNKFNDIELLNWIKDRLSLTTFDIEPIESPEEIKLSEILENETIPEKVKVIINSVSKRVIRYDRWSINKYQKDTYTCKFGNKITDLDPDEFSRPDEYFKPNIEEIYSAVKYISLNFKWRIYILEYPKTINYEKLTTFVISKSIMSNYKILSKYHNDSRPEPKITIF